MIIAPTGWINKFTTDPTAMRNVFLHSNLACNFFISTSSRPPYFSTPNPGKKPEIKFNYTHQPHHQPELSFVRGPCLIYCLCWPRQILRKRSPCKQLMRDMCVKLHVLVPVHRPVPNWTKARKSTKTQIRPWQKCLTNMMRLRVHRPWHFPSTVWEWSLRLSQNKHQKREP